MITKKKKFSPCVKRIRLNPEQAVLFCDCYHSSRRVGEGGSHIADLSWPLKYFCIRGTKQLGHVCGYKKGTIVPPNLRMPAPVFLPGSATGSS